MGLHKFLTDLEQEQRNSASALSTCRMQHLNIC